MRGKIVWKFETPYLAAIGVIMYLTNCDRPDIAFVIAKPTK
jgi:hypothetical protein